ncbi:ATP-binding protein [uncultured Parabacteroides sp.]|uniref:ATP-binding protein n=1 Tax=uncultured Parabacteroides sp. TaxID=512312 RepID=UPI0026347FA0|nr:ATP-binding protein [uncultured Parabacteroides sp.]
MDKNTIKSLIIEYQNFVSEITLIERNIHLSDQLNYVFIGLRRAGKSYLMYQQIQHLLKEGHRIEEILYFNFEDDRLVNLTIEDLDLIKVCYEELYAHRPIFFLDEIQIVEHWEKFSRRLADQKYRVYITGSNAKMLSSEIATTLGGRFIIQNVYSFSFQEYLKANHITVEPVWYFKNRTEIVRTFSAYFYFGGLPELELIEEIGKRQWLSSLFNKIFFGDLITRYSIRNDLAMKVLIRKLAESVKQPSSFNRLSNIVSSTGVKVTTDTIIDYLEFVQATWLIFSIENYASKLVEKVSNRKYYFIDNGLLNLFLIDPETSLLENIVAISLKKKYEDELYFYLQNIEVDFYIPAHKLAIQVSYSLKDEATRKREISALLKIAKVLDADKLLIITRDEEETIVEEEKKITVVPIWKWLLE